MLHLLRDAKKGRGAALTVDEVKGIPKRMRDKTTQWYEDRENPGTLIAWERMGGKKWLKVVVEINGKVRRVRANVVRSAGVVERGNLDEGRYKKITH